MTLHPEQTPVTPDPLNEHRALVLVRRGPHPYVPTCSCGWSDSGYRYEYAAQAEADWHVERAVALGFCVCPACEDRTTHGSED